MRIIENIARFLPLRPSSLPFMSKRRTTMEPPVHLTEPSASPEPVAGCDVCSALARARADSAMVGDWSKVSDAHVEIGRHRAGQHA